MCSFHKGFVACSKTFGLRVCAALTSWLTFCVLALSHLRWLFHPAPPQIHNIPEGAFRDGHCQLVLTTFSRPDFACGSMMLSICCSLCMHCLDPAMY